MSTIAPKCLVNKLKLFFMIYLLRCAAEGITAGAHKSLFEKKEIFLLVTRNSVTKFLKFIESPRRSKPRAGAVEVKPYGDPEKNRKHFYFP